jgi:hypothetical protein
MEGSYGVKMLFESRSVAIFEHKDGNLRVFVRGQPVRIVEINSKSEQERKQFVTDFIVRAIEREETKARSIDELEKKQSKTRMETTEPPRLAESAFARCSNTAAMRVALLDSWRRGCRIFRSGWRIARYWPLTVMRTLFCAPAPTGERPCEILIPSLERSCQASQLPSWSM